jgi:hypothetical protein
MVGVRVWVRVSTCPRLCPVTIMIMMYVATVGRASTLLDVVLWCEVGHTAGADVRVRA